jgi:alpha-L-fucosidase 2
MSDNDKLKLWYTRPAREWLEALPVGNGRLGGMVFGGTEHELIQLNEISLWSGGRQDSDNPEALEKLPEIRQLLFDGRYVEAQKLTCQYLVCKKGTGSNYGDGADQPFGAYQPLCDLKLFFDGMGTRNWLPSEYRRELDLNEAVNRTSYKVKDVRVERVLFASHPAQVIVMRLQAGETGKLSFTATLDREFSERLKIVDGNRIILKGRAHHQKGGMKFECQLLAIPDDGRVSSINNRLFVENATAVTLIVAANTSWRGQNPGKITTAQIEAAAAKSYASLLEEHVADYQRLFKRVEFDIHTKPVDDIPTDRRLDMVKEGGQDPELERICFQYGRYLLISCSRNQLGLPANLQGLWNDKYHPAWSCDYHTNINLQMNYWLSEPTNLAECHQPLFDFIQSLRKPGRRSAKVHYGARGWIVNWASNVWGFTSPGEDPGWGLFSAAAAWLCRHLWEHYEYGGDLAYLKSAYPIMKEAAEFFLDYLVEDPKSGCLVSGPSTSPENRFKTPDGQVASINMGPTMELEIAWDIFTNCIKAGEKLNVDVKFRKTLSATRDRLAPLKIGKDGRLQEWMEEFEEPEPGHRHISHAYALHPGEQITSATPEYMKAIRKSVEYRLSHGGGQTGWSAAWLIGIWARLGDGDKAYEMLQNLFRTNVTANLFNRAHGIPQLDGTFGLTAGISEMLLQSHEEVVSRQPAVVSKEKTELVLTEHLHSTPVLSPFLIRLLPALPKEWANGSVRGLRARGGFEIDIEWRDGAIEKATITSLLGTPCRLSTDGVFFVTCQGEAVATSSKEGVVFETKSKAVYEIKKV